nr:reverse transcriptase domain-containing protein [Tanacetum cinerariifolium]
MSTNEQTPLSQPTSAVTNMLGREQAPQNLAQQKKLKAVKARLDFEEASQYSESETPNRRRSLKERLGPRDSRARSGSPEQRRGRSKSPREKGPERRTVFKRLEKDVFHRLGDMEKNVSAHSRGLERKSYYSSRRDTESCYQSSRSKETKIAFEKHRHKREYSRRTKAVVWFGDLPKESIDSYDDLRKAFLENYLQQKKCIKDPVEIHNIKQRNRESTEEFVRRYKLECRDVKGALECMKIFGFMHEITNPELIKRLHDKIPKSMDEMMSVTATFLRGEMAASNRERKKSKQDRFTLLTKTPREILALDKRKFKPPPPMTTPVEKRNASKFCEFYGEVGHTTDEWEEDGTQGPMIIEAEMGGHYVHRIYVDGGSSSKIIEIIWPVGQISLLVRVGDEEHSTSARMNFMMVRTPSPYNGIIGRPGVRKIRAIPSTAHVIIKFPVAGGIVTLQSSRIIPLECSMVSEPGVPRSAINQVKEENIQVAIHPEQTVAIRSTLTEEGRNELCGLLRCHLDVFAWKPADMTGVPRHIAEHRLNVDEGCLPIRQKKRGQTPERNKAISEEVKKLVEDDIMKEVHYHSWLSNPVMVKKHDDSWRMCLDFKDLNKACPKDDAYKGYHQIKMAEEDEENTTFITSQGIFRYSKMLFGLKNAGATYQRLVDKAFQKQIGRNLEVYVDDLVIKSQMEKEDVQKMNGKLASLNRFLSKSAEKSLPFLKTLKKCTKKSDFQWTPKAEGAFKEMKQSIAELPMLTAPKEKEDLIIYLAAAKEVINAVLMTEGDGKQVPIYFVSRALQGPKIDYTPMEKLILALISASKRLKRYFQAHTVVVITDQPIKQLLSNPEVTGRLLKWRFELGEHDIQYRPRTSVKGQILADFIVDRPEDGAPDTPMEDREKAIDEKEILVVVEEEGHTWMTPVYEYLTEGVLTEEKKKARTIRRKAGRYVVINEVLYKKSFLGPWLWCIGPLYANYVLREIHEGSCSMHAGPRSVVAKALRSSYFWPTMHADARNLIRECKDCQVHRPVPRNPQERLTPITSPWSFYKWGIDIAGPFSEGPAKVKFLIVAIDYFTKWIEARPVATITGTQVKKFVWDNIVCRFGLPGEIISDNGKQFRDNPFKDWCEKLNIRQCFASVKHPQANGLIKRANRSLGEGIKARLGEKNKNWVEEVSHVLWAHRTMIKSSNDETPFSLTYGSEADLLEEKREQDAIQEARNKAKMEGYYNARVLSTSFRPGDFVYRNNEASHVEDRGKLGPKWEGPYEVTEALGKGAYRLRDRNGHTLTRTWNIRNLKKCYMHEM